MPENVTGRFTELLNAQFSSWCKSMVLNIVHSYIFIYLSFIPHDLFTGIVKYYYLTNIWKHLERVLKNTKNIIKKVSTDDS